MAALTPQQRRDRRQEFARRRANLLGIDVQNAAYQADEGRYAGEGANTDSVFASIGGFDFSREIGADHKLFRAEVQDQIVSNPTQFLANKRADYEAHVRDAERVANETYYKNIDEYHYSQEEARRRAIATGKAYFNELMKQHEEQYPDALASTARGKTVVGGGAGAGPANA